MRERRYAIFFLFCWCLPYDLPRRPLSPPRPNSSPTALKLGGPPRGVPPALSTAPGLPQSAGGRGSERRFLATFPPSPVRFAAQTAHGSQCFSLFVTAVALALSVADSLLAALRFFVSVGGITARCLSSSSASWSYSLSLARVAVSLTVRDGSCSCSQRGRCASRRLASSCAFHRQASTLVQQGESQVGFLVNSVATQMGPGDGNQNSSAHRRSHSNALPVHDVGQR